MKGNWLTNRRNVRVQIIIYVHTRISTGASTCIRICIYIYTDARILRHTFAFSLFHTHTNISQLFSCCRLQKSCFPYSTATSVALEPLQLILKVSACAKESPVKQPAQNSLHLFTASARDAAMQWRDRTNRAFKFVRRRKGWCYLTPIANADSLEGFGFWSSQLTVSVACPKNDGPCAVLSRLPQSRGLEA